MGGGVGCTEAESQMDYYDENTTRKQAIHGKIISGVLSFICVTKFNGWRIIPKCVTHKALKVAHIFPVRHL